MHKLAVLSSLTPFSSPGSETDALSQALATALQLPLIGQAEEQAELFLYYRDSRLMLHSSQQEADMEICVDFAAGSLGWRQQHHVAGELIVKAAGGRKARGQRLVDATAGLGQDGFILAAAGFRVQMLEKDPVVHALLSDGLKRAAASEDEALRERVAGITLECADSLLRLGSLEDVQVVYLDPMFPQRRKTAKVKKNMQLMQALLGHPEPDSEQALLQLQEQHNLLQLARQVAQKRVVVKRPRIAPWLGEQKPDLQYSGKSSRFDVYLSGG